jgi:hypothetical protein
MFTKFKFRYFVFFMRKQQCDVWVYVSSNLSYTHHTIRSLLYVSRLHKPIVLSQLFWSEMFELSCSILPYKRNMSANISSVGIISSEVNSNAVPFFDIGFANNNQQLLFETQLFQNVCAFIFICNMWSYLSRMLLPMDSTFCPYSKLESLDYIKCLLFFCRNLDHLFWIQLSYFSVYLSIYRKR